MKQRVNNVGAISRVMILVGALQILYIMAVLSSPDAKVVEGVKEVIPGGIKFLTYYYRGNLADAIYMSSAISVSILGIYLGRLYDKNYPFHLIQLTDAHMRSTKYVMLVMCVSLVFTPQINYILFVLSVVIVLLHNRCVNISLNTIMKQQEESL